MNPINELVLNLIATQRQATGDELNAIITHVTQAPFATYLSRVPTKLRRLLSQGEVSVPRKLSSLEIHLFKRIYMEEQWPIGTTSVQYVADLQQAICHPNIHVWTYHYFGQPFVGFLAPSHVRNAPKLEAYIFVAYSPIHGTITTGYQASDASQIFTDDFTDLVQHQ